VSRDGSSDAGSSSGITGSPRSPRTVSGQPEKTMSAIAATHQTMTSLLSKPSKYIDSASGHDVSSTLFVCYVL